MSAGRIDADGVHRYPVTVQFDEVDQYGIVHHSRYFIYFERARVDLVRALKGRFGGPLEGDFMLVVAGCEVKFKRSARFLDELVVEQGPSRVGASRLQLAYRVRKGTEILADAELVLAFVGTDGRPVRAPAELREALGELTNPHG